MTRTHEHLEKVYQEKRAKILASALYTSGDIFSRHDAGRVLRTNGDEARHALERMSRDGDLEQFTIKIGGRPVKHWKQQKPSQLTVQWVKPWVQTLDYSPQWR